MLSYLRYVNGGIGGWGKGTQVSEEGHLGLGLRPPAYTEDSAHPRG